MKMADVNDTEDRPSLINSGALLSLIAAGTATSRSTLLDASGLSRVTVTQRLNALIDSGLVRETSDTLPSGGRPTRVLKINEHAGFLLVANIGETYIHLATMNLEPAIIAQSTIPFSAADGPASTLEQVSREFEKLAAGAHTNHRTLFGVSLSLPTPVDFKRGRIVGPSVLPGWDEFDITSYLHERFAVPVYLENDVNLMAIYEHRQNFPDIFRGAKGAAGDIGHIQFNSDDAPLCRCGKLGCVEARAAGWAIARDLTNRGFKAENARD
eukprot:gene29563-36248_t